MRVLVAEVGWMPFAEVTALGIPHLGRGDEVGAAGVPGSAVVALGEGDDVGAVDGDLLEARGEDGRCCEGSGHGEAFFVEPETAIQDSLGQRDALSADVDGDAGDAGGIELALSAFDVGHRQDQLATVLHLLTERSQHVAGQLGDSGLAEVDGVDLVHEDHPIGFLFRVHRGEGIELVLALGAQRDADDWVVETGQVDGLHHLTHAGHAVLQLDTRNDLSGVQADALGRALEEPHAGGLGDPSEADAEVRGPVLQADVLLAGFQPVVDLLAVTGGEALGAGEGHAFADHLGDPAEVIVLAYHEDASQLAQRHHTRGDRGEGHGVALLQVPRIAGDQRTAQLEGLAEAFHAEVATVHANRVIVCHLSYLLWVSAAGAAAFPLEYQVCGYTIVAPQKHTACSVLL